MHLLIYFVTTETGIIVIILLMLPNSNVHVSASYLLKFWTSSFDTLQSAWCTPRFEGTNVQGVLNVGTHVPDYTASLQLTTM